MRGVGRRVVGEARDTWWWNEEVEEAIEKIRTVVEIVLKRKTTIIKA